MSRWYKFFGNRPVRSQFQVGVDAAIAALLPKTGEECGTPEPEVIPGPRDDMHAERAPLFEDTEQAWYCGGKVICFAGFITLLGCIIGGVGYFSHEYEG